MGNVPGRNLPLSESVRYGVLRGPCNATLDGPKDVRAENRHGFVKYYNIKYGEIGSTFSGSTGRRLYEPMFA